MRHQTETTATQNRTHKKTQQTRRVRHIYWLISHVQCRMRHSISVIEWKVFEPLFLCLCRSFSFFFFRLLLCPPFLSLFIQRQSCRILFLTFTHYITKYAMNGTLCIQFTRFDFTRAFFCAPFSASHLQKTWSIHMKSTRRHIDRQTDRHNWIFLIWMLVFLRSAIVVLHGFVAFFLSFFYFFGMCATLCARSTMYWN